MVEIQIYKTLPDSVKNARAYLRASIIGKALEIKQLQGEPMKWWVFKSFHSETDVAELLSASKEGFDMKRME